MQRLIWHSNLYGAGAIDWCYDFDTNKFSKLCSVDRARECDYYIVDDLECFLAKLYMSQVKICDFGLREGLRGVKLYSNNGVDFYIGVDGMYGLLILKTNHHIPNAFDTLGGFRLDKWGIEGVVLVYCSKSFIKLLTENREMLLDVLEYMNFIVEYEGGNYEILSLT